MPPAHHLGGGLDVPARVHLKAEGIELPARVP